MKNEIERDVVISNLYEFDMKAWYKGYFGKIEESDGQYHNILKLWHMCSKMNLMIRFLRSNPYSACELL